MAGNFHVLLIEMSFGSDKFWCLNLFFSHYITGVPNFCGIYFQERLCLVNIANNHLRNLTGSFRIWLARFYWQGRNWYVWLIILKMTFCTWLSGYAQTRNIIYLPTLSFSLNCYLIDMYGSDQNWNFNKSFNSFWTCKDWPWYCLN